MNVNEMIEIVPLIGIRTGDRHINLSASKASVEAVLGKPDKIRKDSFYYFQNELRIDFDAQGLVTFIEFLGGVDGTLQPRIYGIKAFQADADALYAVLKEKNNGDIIDNERGYSYAFSNLSVGIWRQSTPESIQEMITEAATDGNPLSEADLADEIKLAAHWATIGIGVKNYYS